MLIAPRLLVGAQQPDVLLRVYLLLRDRCAQQARYQPSDRIDRHLADR